MKVDGDRLWVPSGCYCVIIFLFAVSFSRKANVQLSATDPDYAICSAFPNCRFTFSVGKWRCFLGGQLCWNIKPTGELKQTAEDNSTSQLRLQLRLSYCTHSSHWDGCLACTPDWTGHMTRQGVHHPDCCWKQESQPRAGQQSVKAPRLCETGGPMWAAVISVAVMVELFHWCKRVIMFSGIMGPTYLHKHVKYTRVFIPSINQKWLSAAAFATDLLCIFGPPSREMALLSLVLQNRLWRIL